MAKLSVWAEIKAEKSENIINQIYALFDLGHLTKQKLTELLIALRALNAD